MSSEALIGIVMLGMFAGLFLMGYLRNAGPANRWEHRRRSAGEIHCGGCRRVGTLSIRTTSTGCASSSNMVLACSSCGSSDWKILP